jgi:hypothetical protein
VGKILHHFVPLSLESLLKQHIDIIVCSIVFISFHHGGFLGCARAVVFKRDKLKTQISILGPHRGHALKKQSRGVYSDTTDLDYFQDEMRTKM